MGGGITAAVRRTVVCTGTECLRDYLEIPYARLYSQYRRHGAPLSAYRVPGGFVGVGGGSFKRRSRLGGCRGRDQGYAGFGKALACYTPASAASPHRVCQHGGIGDHFAYYGVPCSGLVASTCKMSEWEARVWRTSPWARL